MGFKGRKGSKKGSYKGFQEGAVEKAHRRQKHAFSESTTPFACALKKDKKGRTSPDRETPPFETPPFSGP